MISEKSASRRQKRRFRFKDVNGMSDTFRQEKLSDFTIIRNSIFKDTNLSAKAKGVACQLLSLPPTWDYSIKGLVTLFNDGEASIRNALSELEEAGYLRRERVRDQGKLGKCVYIITDSLKCEKPNVENPHVENPHVENRAQLNTKELTTYSNKTSKNRFTPPTVEEVAEYIREKGYHIDAEQFVDYYESNGWRVGGKSKMVDFRAAVRNWERRRRNDEKDKTPQNPFMKMLEEGDF